SVGANRSRSSTRLRPKWALTLLIAVGTAAGATGVILNRDSPTPEASPSDLSAVVEQPIGPDPDGDKLPDGALLRIASARFRGGAHTAAYSLDGRVLTTVGGRRCSHLGCRDRPAVASATSRNTTALSCDG